MNSSLAIFIVLIVAIVMCSKVILAWIEKRNVKPDVDQEFEEALAKVDKLEERIRVLERIITENRYDLKKEIDSL